MLLVIESHLIIITKISYLFNFISANITSPSFFGCLFCNRLIIIPRTIVKILLKEQLRKPESELNGTD